MAPDLTGIRQDKGHDHLRRDDPRLVHRQVGVAGHLTVGKGVVATAQSGIPNSVDAGAFISGYPAIDNRDWLKSSAIFRKLPDLKRTLADLQKRLDALEERSKR